MPDEEMPNWPSWMKDAIQSHYKRMADGLHPYDSLAALAYAAYLRGSEDERRALRHLRREADDA